MVIAKWRWGAADGPEHMGEPCILLRNVASQQVWGLTSSPHRQELKLRAQTAQTTTCSVGGGEAEMEAHGGGRGDKKRRLDITSLFY